MAAHYTITFMARGEPEEAVMLRYDGPDRALYESVLRSVIRDQSLCYGDPGTLAARWIMDEVWGGYGLRYSIVAHDYDSTADREFLVECTGPNAQPRVTSRPGGQIRWDDETEAEDAAC